MTSRLLALLCVFGGCGGVAGEKPPPVAISIVSGDQQTGIVGTPLAAPLVVEVVELGGEPLANLTINFTATNGTVSAPTSLTDALGHAQVTLELGELAGSATVEVTSPDASGTTFTATSRADVPATIEIATFDNPMGVVDTLLADPVVAVVHDRFGNLVEGADVRFTVTTNNGSLDTIGGLTDVDGESRAHLTLGTLAGQNVVEARTGELDPARFEATGVADVAAQLAASCNSTSAIAGTTLADAVIATVTDRHGNPVAGQTVAFVVTTGNGSVAAQTATTGADGRASSAWTLGPQVGANTLEARLGTLPVATVAATGTVGNAAQVAVTAGNTQTATVGTNLAPFAVTVKDANGNVRPNTSVSFVVTANNGTLSAPTATTNASGVAQSTLTLGTAAGTNLVEARVAGLAPAVFAATGRPGAPASITAISGGGQVKPVTSALSPFVVVVKDGFGNAVPGVGVDFVVTSGGGSSTGAATTDGQGQAAGVLTLGTIAGTNTVEARVTGLGPATFSATATPGPPGQVQFVSNNNAFACTNTTAFSPFIVRVTDAQGNVRASADTIQWTIDASSCMQSTLNSSGRAADCANPFFTGTDGQGRATAFAFPTQAGRTTIVARVASAPNVSFAFGLDVFFETSNECK